MRTASSKPAPGTMPAAVKARPPVPTLPAWPCCVVVEPADIWPPPPGPLHQSSPVWSHAGHEDLQCKAKHYENLWYFGMHFATGKTFAILFGLSAKCHLQHLLGIVSHPSDFESCTALGSDSSASCESAQVWIGCGLGNLHCRQVQYTTQSTPFMQSRRRNKPECATRQRVDDSLKVVSESLC